MMTKKAVTTIDGKPRSLVSRHARNFWARNPLEPLLRGATAKEGSMSIQLSFSLSLIYEENAHLIRGKNLSMRERESASRSSLSVAFLPMSHAIRTWLSFVNARLQRRCIHTTYIPKVHPALPSSWGSQVASALGWGAGSCPPSFLPSSLPPSTEGRVSQSEFLEFSLLKQTEARQEEA